jgi:4-hydroxy-2-oxoheptanedioate aldolase
MIGQVNTVSIQKRLGDSRPLLCSWLMMPGRFQAGAYAGNGLAGDAGLDSVLIDMQHGMIGYAEMVEMVEAVVGAGGYAIVRPPLGDFAMVSRALDVGASGIVFPMINTPDDARALVEAAKFPPIGGRSWGAYLGQSLLGLDKSAYLAQANGLNAVFAMIETKQALDNLDEICAVDGLDGLFVGPNDLCISLTNGEAADVNHPIVQDALPKIVAASKKAKKFAGIYTATCGQVKKYGEMGFCLMPAISDVAFIASGVQTTTNQLN